MNFTFVLHSSFMALPFFYSNELNRNSTQFVLDEDTSKHVVQVLRMQNGELIRLTDGKGGLYTASIADNNRKRCAVNITECTQQQRMPGAVSLAVSLVKNNSRLEWLLEKATELGVAEIIPLLCSRTEKQHFRRERMQGILISAMLQSQQTWLPALHEPTKLYDLVLNHKAKAKYIAHCENENNKMLLQPGSNDPNQQKIILIGPEGDFTPEEIRFTLQHGYQPVSLGNTRLRTETAGLVACVLLIN